MAEITLLMEQARQNAEDEATNDEVKRFMQVQKERGEQAEHFEMSSDGKQDKEDEEEGFMGWGDVFSIFFF